MAFGLNRAEIIGRLGADVTVNHLANGGRVANLSAGERVRGTFHIQTVNSRHSQLKGFLRQYRGVATKYLKSYLRWFHLIVLGSEVSPRACLAAAMGGSSIHNAN